MNSEEQIRIWEREQELRESGKVDDLDKVCGFSTLKKLSLFSRLTLSIRTYAHRLYSHLDPVKPRTLFSKLKSKIRYYLLKITSNDVTTHSKYVRGSDPFFSNEESRNKSLEHCKKHEFSGGISHMETEEIYEAHKSIEKEHELIEKENEEEYKKWRDSK